MKISVETTVSAPVEKVWRTYTNPEDKTTGDRPRFSCQGIQKTVVCPQFSPQRGAATFE